MDQTTVKLTIREDDLVTSVIAQHGARLLDVLRRFGRSVPAPCNGQGTCRKCLVRIEGSGPVLSCTYRLEKDTEIILTTAGDAQILFDRTVAHNPLENDSGLRLREGVVYFRDRALGVPRSPRHFGLAIDIGTTTVVIYLADLNEYSVLEVASFINPQTQFGHDVISRIHQTMSDAQGLPQLQRILIDRINRAIDDLCRRQAIEKGEIWKATVVGNTTMLHLFCGVDPASIAVAPFTPAFIEEKLLRAAELGLAMHPGGAVLVLPSISGYVGADISAGIATTPMARPGETSLFIDIGTNGEMALSRGEELICCSTAAGPAFEGATIQCGVGGIEGAVSAYTCDGYQTIGNGPPIGICGSGLVDLVATLLGNGAVDPSGYMEKDFLVVPGADTASGTDIVLTPLDIRQVQLAKAAIAAGIRVLLDQTGCSLSAVGTLYIGGGFGSFMDIDSAAAIGLIPHELRDAVVTTGNVAGRGALSALLSRVFEERVGLVASRARYLELSAHTGFVEHYVEQMNFLPAPGF